MDYSNSFGDMYVADASFLHRPEYPFDYRPPPSGHGDTEDGKFDQEAGIPHRLKRLFKVHDVLQDQDLSNLAWDVLVSRIDDSPGVAKCRQRPPPPEDPRTHLPDVFGFRGWNSHGNPSFYIRDGHPPCYPQELLGRLKTLHETGAGGRREEGVAYAVTSEICDLDITGSDDGIPAVRDADDPDGDSDSVSVALSVYREDHGHYETLELANDAAMTLFEKAESTEFRKYLNFEESSNEDEGRTPDFHCGLHRIPVEGQENRARIEDGLGGATWRLDNLGCLRLTGYTDQDRCRFTVTKLERESSHGQKPRASNLEDSHPEDTLQGDTKQGDTKPEDSEQGIGQGKAPRREQGIGAKKTAEKTAETSKLPVPGASTSNSGAKKRSVGTDIIGPRSKRPRHRKRGQAS